MRGTQQKRSPGLVGTPVAWGSAHRRSRLQGVSVVVALGGGMAFHETRLQILGAMHEGAAARCLNRQNW